MKNKKLFFVSIILMVLLGASDALRGIFSPLFLNVYGFSVSQLGIIVSISYLGNLICLLFGGVLLDKIGAKRALLLFVLLLSLSEGLLLFGNIYAFLLIGFFFSLGISTLLNTTINIISYEFSDTKALMYLNIVFFLQGVGMTSSQLVLTKFASSLLVFHGVIISFMIVLILIAIAISRLSFTNKRPQIDADHSLKTVISKNEYRPLILITMLLAFYLIAEHSVMNYIMVYGTDYLNMDQGKVGNALALFSFGIMIGRLVLAPVVDRLGAKRIILCCLIVGAISYFIVFDLSMIYFVVVSGLSCSIVYPTVVNLVKNYVPSSIGARATTFVISIASLFDVVFNFIYGFAIEKIGYGVSMSLLPLFMVLSSLAMLLLIKSDKRRLNVK